MKFWIYKVLFVIYLVTLIPYTIVLFKRENSLFYILNLFLFACMVGELVYIFKVAQEEEGSSLTVNVIFTIVNICYILLVFLVSREITSQQAMRYHTFREHQL
jgi:heme/copper-type cytochrome/quinol oxidase subunit 4